MKITNIYELTPQPKVNQKSFYGKAHILKYSDGTEILKNYDTLIIKRCPDGKLFRLWDGWSLTTGKHIKAFTGLNKTHFFELPKE